MFYSDTVRTLGDIAEKKAAFLQENPLGYFIAAMMAGAYVGVGVFLAFSVGAPMADAHSPWMKAIMGASFSIALSLVVFAGAELFTGNNLVMPIGMWRGKASLSQLLSIWSLSWLGNLVGATLLAVILFYSTVLNAPAALSFVQQMAGKKMSLSIVEMLARGALCNWLVCLAVWCAYRMKSEAGRIVMIFWCLYAFVASGFEHSVANMTLFSLALLQPQHAAHVTLAAAGMNLLWVTIGNIIGGAIFVGGAYWIASHAVRADMQYAAQQVPAQVTAG